MPDRVTIVMVADLGADAVAAFRRYESLVLPMLARHGGRLERRVRDASGLLEVHLVSFADRAGYDAYLADPERAGHRGLLAGLEVHQRMAEVHDVPEAESFPGPAGG